MRTKYKYIGFKFIEEDEKLEQFFEKQAKKGWMLDKIGISFLKFKKTEEKNLKFFIDCNRPTDDYIYSLEQYGYHFVDNFKMFNVFYSENLYIEPIQSDPVVKAIAHKELCKPWSIILFFILGLLIYGISDLFDLSTLYFRTFDHIILHFHNFLIYLLLKLLAVDLILNAIIILILRMKYNREIKGFHFPAIITQCLMYVNYFIEGFSFVYCIVFLIIFSINDISLFISFILFSVIYTIFNHYINKEIIKIEAKSKRIGFTILAILLFIGTHHIISDSFIQEDVGSKTSTAYQSDVYNYAQHTRGLLYTINTRYGTSDKKNEFDQYIQTYRETIYQCRNETIAKSIFRALVRDSDNERRMPSDEEIDRIAQEKGSFSSIDDVPFYSYQKSLKNLKQYSFKNTDICCGYDNNYIAIRDNIVYDLVVKENTDIQKLIDFYK